MINSKLKRAAKTVDGTWSELDRKHLLAIYEQFRLSKTWEGYLRGLKRTSTKRRKLNCFPSHRNSFSHIHNQLLPFIHRNMKLIRFQFPRSSVFGPPSQESFSLPANFFSSRAGAYFNILFIDQLISDYFVSKESCEESGKHIRLVTKQALRGFPSQL